MDHDEMQADVEALIRVSNIIKNSTFRGDGAAVVSVSLNLLQEMLKQRIAEINNGNQEAESE